MAAAGGSWKGGAFVPAPGGGTLYGSLNSAQQGKITAMRRYAQTHDDGEMPRAIYKRTNELGRSEYFIEARGPRGAVGYQLTDNGRLMGIRLRSVQDLAETEAL